LKAWPALAVVLLQIILFAAHGFVYLTWSAFASPLVPAAAAVRTTVFVLAFSFVAASLLSFRFVHPAVRFFYWLAAVWLGFLNGFFYASLLLWPVWFVLQLLHLAVNPAAVRPLLAAAFYLSAVAVGIYGLVNARIICVRSYTVRLPGLPDSWRGRRAVLLSDLHLGAINGPHFARRLALRAARLRPDIVFLPGDLFDGAHADLNQLLTPLRRLIPPLGAYYSTGNHEEFTDPTHYLEAITRAGIRVLANESVTVDGVTIAGVLYHDSSSPLRMKAVLDGLHLDRTRPAILLNHAPMRLPLVEQAGFSLQLSGHTHGGQIFPFTWLTRRVYGRFIHGLHRFGALQVCTSTGAGAWGPPMRVGTRPEIVLLTFE
jgi:hypothetical protein